MVCRNAVGWWQPNPKGQTMQRKLSNPCPTEYRSEHFRGKHNLVPIMADAPDSDGKVRSVGSRCVSCGAR